MLFKYFNAFGALFVSEVSGAHSSLLLILGEQYRLQIVLGEQ
jgi:hypothetical protein